MIRAALILFVLLAAGAGAEERVLAGLSQNRVSITANFDGSELLVFGAIQRSSPPPEGPPLEVIVTVAGPHAPVNVRRKNRVLGIWINTEAVEIDAAPSFYAIAATGPLFDVLSHTEDLRHRVSIPVAIRSVGAPPEVEEAARFTDALIRLRRASTLYRVEAGDVELTEETLFQTGFDLPANLTEGNYEVRIFLTRDRVVLDHYSTILYVQKVGLERMAHALAHERPHIYGVLSLVLAVVAGWGASAAFRYIRT